MNQTSEYSETPAAQEMRVSARLNMFVLGALYWDELSTPVRLRNMSMHGALVEASVLPSEGCDITLCRGRLAARGKVTWRSHNQAGLLLQDSVEPNEWLQSRLRVEQQRVDDMIAEVRSGVGGSKKISAYRPAVGDPFPERQLTSIVASVEELARVFAGDTHILEHHGESLQNLDIVVGRLHRLMKAYGCDRIDAPAEFVAHVPPEAGTQFAAARSCL